MENNNAVTKKDLNDVFWRVQLLGITNNYERMQSIGFLTCITPILKRLYKDADKETRSRAMKRHLEFYNSHVNSGALILGVTAAMEEITAEEEKDVVVSLKTGLMGPLAGLGDSLLKFTWLPICGSIGAAFALEKNIMGPILMFLMYNSVNWLTKYYGVHWGYSKGIEFFEGAQGKQVIQRVSNMANVVGLMVIGGLIATSVKIKTDFAINIEEQTIPLQEMFDKVMPNLLTIIVTFAVYYILKKNEGKHTVLMIISIMVISVILCSLGLIA